MQDRPDNTEGMSPSVPDGETPPEVIDQKLAAILIKQTILSVCEYGTRVGRPYTMEELGEMFYVSPCKEDGSHVDLIELAERIIEKNKSDFEQRKIEEAEIRERMRHAPTMEDIISAMND